MNIGYFAPLPPARTGVADYAETLLRALRQRGSVQLDAANAGINLYHIGNNHLHRDIYFRAIQRPGVVILHDAVLHHFYLGALRREEYIDEFVHNYGEWMRDHAAALWDRRALSGTDAEYFRYPMLKRIAASSRAVVVHNQAAAAMVRTHAPSATIVEIPHLFAGAPPVDVEARERLRRSLGVPARGRMFGIFGHLRESKRVYAVLRAFQRVRNEYPASMLLLAGECASRDLERGLAAYAGYPGLLRRGYLPESEFWAYAHAVDSCINLRYPSAGETSGIAVRFMGAGKAVMLSEGLEIARIPPAACVRVETGIREEASIAHYMAWVNEFPHDAEDIGRRAAAHVRTAHSVAKVADELWEVLRRAA